MNVMESSPYEPFVRGFDYVRLASITAGSENEVTQVNRCLDAAKACNVDEMCQRLRTEYVSSCIRRMARADTCNRSKCHKALRKFFDRVPPRVHARAALLPLRRHRLRGEAAPDHRAHLLVRGQGEAQLPGPTGLLPGELRVQVGKQRSGLSRYAEFQVNCRPATQSATGCRTENYAACLLAYTGIIGSPITPNYIDNSTSHIAPWCTCNASGNRQEECEGFLRLFTENPCLENAIQAFGNGTHLSAAAGPPSTPPTTQMRKQERNANRAAATLRENILEQLQPTQMTAEEKLPRDATHVASNASNSALALTIHSWLIVWCATSPITFLLVSM
ncbi:hypothetical protein lerEdw1_019964 [Lerista edwardsae]|nr:hypothetical protein lerEdw1_019964 [Lerista edwardsae]